MKTVQALLLFTGMALSAIPNAFAFNLLQINPSGAHVGGAGSFDTGFGPHAGIDLPDGASTSSFAFGFILPNAPDYVPGDRIRVAVLWHTDASTPCSLTLKPNSISVARRGSEHIVGAGASTGLSPTNGTSKLDASDTNVTAVKVYEITPPDGVTPFQPYDTINLGLFRAPADTNDTCAGSLKIQGIAVLFGD